MSEGSGLQATRYGGRFEPETEVGHGGMGLVYRARDIVTGETVALKVLHEREGPNADRFSQESSLLAELPHPAIVRYIDHGVTPSGEHYLVMEWLDGVALEDHLTGGALSILETAALAARILDALAMAHWKGIVHRDIKPANIFLPGRRLDQAKLLDFGIARRLAVQRRLTQAGSTLGTPMYMSPEQARGERDIDPRADIFALGCVLFECLTGRPPFTGETPIAVLAKICLDDSLNVVRSCPGLPAIFQQRLASMLEKDRAQRPPETGVLAREFAALEQHLRQTGHRLPETQPDLGTARDSGVITAGEQRLFSVVMVSLPRKDSGKDPKRGNPDGTPAAVRPSASALAPPPSFQPRNEGRPRFTDPAGGGVVTGGAAAARTAPAPMPAPSPAPDRRERVTHETGPVSTETPAAPPPVYVPARPLEERARKPSPTPPPQYLLQQTPHPIHTTASVPLAAVGTDLRNDEMMNRVRRAMQPFKVQVDRLYNGSLVVTQTGHGVGSDQIVNISRCALELKKLLPTGSIALCTAPADAHDELPISRVLERAGWLAMGAPAGQIRIDDVSADLLETRFEIGRGEEYGQTFKFLRYEKGLREPPRTVLGKHLPCLGRDRELRSLEALYDECTTESVARAMLVTAPAGGGKSRVRFEFLEHIADRGQRFECLIARGDSMREAVPFGLLGAALRAAADIGGTEDLVIQRKRFTSYIGRNLSRVTPDRDKIMRIIAFMGEIADVPFLEDDIPALRTAREDPRVMADQIRLAWLDWIDAETAAGPVVLVLEDVHWGDFPSVDLVDAAMRIYPTRPFLALAFARPEIDERFPKLWQDNHVEHMTLRPLTSKACQRLAQQVLPDLTAEKAAWIVERADGNPFFLEELVRMIAAGGDLPKGGAPVTVLSLVQARLDALGEEAKRILRAASVFGQTFRRSSITALLGDAVERDLDAWLGILSDKEIIFPRNAGPSREFGFRHALLRDAAYDMLTDGDKITGHRLAAEWLERAGEREAIVLVEHYERAAIPKKAAHWCRFAAEQAFEANDLEGTIARAERGMRNGATDAVLAHLQRVSAKAKFWKSDFKESQSEALAASKVLSGAAGYEALSVAVSSLGRLGAVQEIREIVRDLECPADLDARNFWAECVCTAANWLLWAGDQALFSTLIGRIESIKADLTGSALGVYKSMLGFICRSREEDIAALPCFQEAMGAFAEVPDERRLAMTRVNFGAALDAVGRSEEAQTVLSDAWNTTHRLAASAVQMGASLNLVSTMRRLHQYDEAIKMGCEALAQAIQNGDKWVAGVLHICLAQSYSGQGRHEDALRHANAGVNLVGPFTKARAMACLAECLFAARKESEAAVWACAAYENLSDSESSREGEMMIMHIHVRCLVHLGKLEEARLVLSKALSVLQKRIATIQDASARQSFIANMYEHQGLLSLGRNLGVDGQS